MEANKENTKLKSILVIDDSMPNIELIKEILSRKNYNVKSALNASDAFILISNEKPDLILLDLMMPETDGFEFLTILNNNKEIKDIPVVVVTAINETQSKERAYALGVKDYITKPFHIAEMFDKVEKNF